MGKQNKVGKDIYRYVVLVKNSLNLKFHDVKIKEKRIWDPQKAAINTLTVI